MTAMDPLIQEAVYHHQRRAYDRAEAAYKRVLKKFPANVNALFYLSLLYGQTGAYTRAISGLESYIRACPQSAEGYYNLGLAYQNAERFKDALAAYDNALKIDQKLTAAYNNRGVILRKMGSFEQAQACYEKALSLNPTFADAFLNLAHLELSLGNFERGWKNYEWRKKTEAPVGHQQFERPAATSLVGQAGKRILVHWEQGLGDTIQFCRYVPLLIERGFDVLFQPQEKLKRLMKTLHPPLKLADEPAADFDLHAPLLSLPMLCDTQLDSVPAKVPYLSAEAELITNWAQRIGSSGFKVGICWKGGSTFKNDQERSFSLSHFKALSKIEGVRLISLQKGDGEAELASLGDPMGVETLGPDFDSGPDAFLDTAACMKCLDLVVTSDTSVAHLAGALGVPVWVALTHVPDFRWMLERQDSPWYPTMRLFRQSSPGDWQGLFGDIAATLKLEISAQH